jgi:hypothetical protein
MKRGLPVPSGAQLPPQEVNSWGPTLRFWVPIPKTTALVEGEA